MRYDRAFYINLDSSPRRRRKLLACCARGGLHDLRRYSAIDGHRVDIATYQERGLLAADLAVRMAGSLGCFLSHVTLWQRLHDDPQCEVALILEDDARPRRGFAAALAALEEEEVPEDWDMIWLGYFRARGTPIGTRFIKPRFPSGRGENSGHFCYLIRARSVPKLIDILTPYDNRSSKDVLLRRSFDRFNAYFLTPRIASSAKGRFISDRQRVNARAAGRGPIRALLHRLRRELRG